MQELKSIIGALDLDSPEETIGKGFHRAARNVVFRGLPPNRRVEKIKGVVPVGGDLLPSGTNKNIGRYYDSKNKRIYIFNYNSEGNHGIYSYNTLSETFSRLVEVGINTSGDPLDFDAEMLSNIDVLYGDSEQGDILYFIDSNGVPSKININRALSSGYGTIERSFLNVIKQPASIPPYVVYEDDPDNTVNALRKKLFRVKTRWVFDDKDKSVTSSQSIMAIPFASFDQSVDADPTRNCRLAITYQTGPSNVKKVEIWVSNSVGNEMSNYYLVASIDKEDQGMDDNDISTYLFYNDKGYTEVGLTVDESGQLFDYVPLYAEAQCILNGNVAAYGGVTEGYPNLTNFTFDGNTSNVSKTSTNYYTGTYFTNLIANQSGDSAFGSGVIHICIRGTVISPSISLDTYYVNMTDGTNISYTLSSGDDAADAIEGLRVNAISKGYTIVSVGNNDLYVSKVNISLAGVKIDSNYSYNLLLNGSFNAYDWSSKYGFGLVYFDEGGRTNGVVYTSGFSVDSIPYDESSPLEPFIPKFTATIYHQPPEWADYFHWVRTKDLTKSKIQQWITDRTFKDTTTLSGVIKYAYLSIESLNAFVLANPGSPLGYGFAAGDRVRFFKRYNPDNTTANLYGNSKDFEVVASVTNPVINGETKSGQFIKLILPSTDGTFDFGENFANYFIELYTPAQPVSNGLNLYNEFGERYTIGNPTLSNRFHQGQLQNQTADYATPATFEFIKGDYYVKNRSVQVGNVYTYNILNGSLTAGRFLFGMTFVGSTYAETGVTGKSVALANISGNTPSGGISPGSDSRWFLESVPVKTYRVRGTISLNFTTTVAGDVWRIFLLNKFNERQYLVDNFSAAAAGVYTFNIDTYTTQENDWQFLIAEGGERPVTILASEITFSIDHLISQKMIDSNFSDYYASAVNSNGRSFLFDENANTVTYPTMYRWSLEYQEDTNVNRTSRFFPENFDTANRSYGGIMAMRSWRQRLTFFQELRCGQTGIYQKFITDNTGQSQLTTTSEIISKNNIQYYDGEFGVYNQATSIVQSGYVYYFVDPVKCKILRLSNDGVTDLTETYNVQAWGAQNLSRYINPAAYPSSGGSQKVAGVFNIREDKVGEYLLLAQGSVDGAGETFSFEEKFNGFAGHYDIDCENLVCAENVLYALKNGLLYRQEGVVYSYFFGVQYDSSITFVFNDQSAIKKIFNAVGCMSNEIWNSDSSGDVKTNHYNYQTGLQQVSLIMEEDYDTTENPKTYAAFNKDMNSMASSQAALWEGDELCGEYIVVKFKSGSNSFSFMFAPFITWQIDNRNP